MSIFDVIAEQTGTASPKPIGGGSLFRRIAAAVGGGQKAPGNQDFGGLFNKYLEPDLKTKTSTESVISKKPKTNKVRIKPIDFITAIPGAAVDNLTGKTGIFKFGGEVLQSIARNTASAGVSTANALNTLAGEPLSEGIPAASEQDSPVEEAFKYILFGGEEVKPIGTRIDEAQRKGVEKYGLSPGVAGAVSAPLVVGSIALDLFGGSGEKAAIEEGFKRLSVASKADEVQTIWRSLARKLRLGASDGAALESKLINAKTSQEVADVVSNYKLSKDFATETGDIVDFIDGFKKAHPGVNPAIVETEIADAAQVIKESGEPVASQIKKMADLLDARAAELKPVIDDAAQAAAGLADDVAPFLDPTKPTTQLERGFITTVKDSPVAAEEVASKIASTYNPISNAATLEEAKNLIKQSYDDAYKLVFDTKAPATATSNAVAQLLTIEAQNAGRFEEAIKLVETTAKRATEQGQAIQALSIFNRLTPEGVLRYTQNMINQANDAVRPGKRVVLSVENAKDLTKQANKIAKMADGEEKAVETALLLRKITDLLPVSFARKVATTQTLFQLLNPKTVIRNMGGNLGFSALENISDVFGAAIDSPLSLLTGKRSKVLPSLPTQMIGFKEGLKQGIRDALHGIDTGGVPTQFDLPKTGVFKNKVGQMAEKTLNVVLKAPDRAMYKAAYDGSLYNQMKAAGVAEPTEEMIEKAHFDGLYRTFQDDSALSKVFVGLKKAVNSLTGGEFGLGDIVLKYPKTPANILSRGIAYSPAGFLNTVYQLAKPLIGKPFNQKAFVEATSRALVGSSSLIGTGALLHRFGIISGKREKDKDIDTLQKETGLGQYKINISALKRFVLSGMDPEAAKLQDGDTQVSYDWFQPAAIGISMGANIDEGAKDWSLVSTLAESLANGVDTLAEQPLVQGITRFLKYGDASDAIMQTATQIPSSFVPTLLNQVRQLVDNTKRNTYDPDVMHYAFNLARNRVPGASMGLPPQIGVFGDEQEVYQNGSNNLFNVFFNPAFVTKYKPTPEAKLVLDLFNETGETKQAPRVTGKTATINGETKKLTPTQIAAFQRFIGTVTKARFHNIATNPSFYNLTPEEKVNYMSNELTDIGSAGKVIILGNQPKKMSTRARAIMRQYLQANPVPEGQGRSFNPGVE